MLTAKDLENLNKYNTVQNPEQKGSVGENHAHGRQEGTAEGEGPSEVTNLLENVSAEAQAAFLSGMRRGQKGSTAQGTVAPDLLRNVSAEAHEEFLSGIRRKPKR